MIITNWHTGRRADDPEHVARPMVVRVDQDTEERVERHRRAHAMPSRAAAVRDLIRRALNDAARA